MLPVKHLESYLTQGLAEHRIMRRMPWQSPASSSRAVRRPRCFITTSVPFSSMPAGPTRLFSELETAVGLRSDFPEARVLLAGLLGAAGRTDDAAAQYEVLLGSDPKNLDVRRALARLYLAPGVGRRPWRTTRRRSRWLLAPPPCTTSWAVPSWTLDSER
jgi:hypothetical protein